MNTRRKVSCNGMIIVSVIIARFSMPDEQISDSERSSGLVDERGTLRPEFSGSKVVRADLDRPHVSDSPWASGSASLVTIGPSATA